MMATSSRRDDRVASPPAATASRAPKASSSSFRASAPGDRARVTLDTREAVRARRDRGAARAVAASASSRPALTIASDKCGGCQLQHMRYDAQLEAKRGIIRDSLTRIGKRAVELPDDRAERRSSGAIAASSRSRCAGATSGDGSIGLHPYDDPGRRLSARRLPDHRRARDGGLATGHGGAARTFRRPTSCARPCSSSTTALPSSWKAATLAERAERSSRPCRARRRCGGSRRIARRTLVAERGARVAAARRSRR